LVLKLPRWFCGGFGNTAAKSQNTISHQAIAFIVGIPEIWPEYVRYVKTKTAIPGNRACDLRDFKWAFPTTLLPLGCLIRELKVPWIAPNDSDVANYFQLMLHPKILDFSRMKTYIPIMTLPKNVNDANALVDYVARFHDEGRGFGGENAFKYLIGELTTNIYEHSQFTSAFVMAQKYEKKGFLEMAFFDDGITIPGSLRNAGFRIQEDWEAVLKATEGSSSKVDTARGYGLSTNVRMCTRGLAGRILVVSAGGAVEYGEGKRNQYIPSTYRFRDSNYSLSGTLVSVRIPMRAREVDVYEYAGPDNHDS
jgi:hypothetical protein